LERIREIRASERRFYQKITDIYALSADYSKEAVTTKDFFASVQNKLHFESFFVYSRHNSEYQFAFILINLLATTSNFVILKLHLICGNIFRLRLSNISKFYFFNFFITSSKSEI